LGEGTDRRLLLLHRVAALVDQRRNAVNGPNQHRHGRQRDPTQFGIDLKHEHERKSRRKRRVDRVHHPRTKVHAHPADVFADSVHQVASGVAAVKGLVQVLVVAVDVVFEFVLNVARHDDQGLAHQKGEGAAQGTEQQNERGVAE
jgi:hypothetical protein